MGVPALSLKSLRNPAVIAAGMKRQYFSTEKVTQLGLNLSLSAGTIFHR
jgi:hypothetical protein